MRFDPDDFDDPSTALEAAADVIDEQEDELETAQAQASAFDNLVQAHDVDPDQYDDAQAVAQAVIDQRTEQTRRDIAELEANELPSFDVADVEARAEELAGKSPQALQNTLNARKAAAFDAQQAKASKGAAAAKGDQRGQANQTDLAGGADGSGAAADDVALAAMDGGDRIAAESRGQTPAEYVEDEYGLQAAQYDAGDELLADILADSGEGN